MYVDTQLSEDAARRANRPGPKGCQGAAAMRQRAAWPDSQSGAAPRTTTCRPHLGNAGYAETVNRLLESALCSVALDHDKEILCHHF